jgi:hypothetical protein
MHMFAHFSFQLIRLIGSSYGCLSANMLCMSDLFLWDFRWWWNFDPFGIKKDRTFILQKWESWTPYLRKLTFAVHLLVNPLQSHSWEVQCITRFRKVIWVDLVIRFLVVELIYSGSNSRFDMGVAFTINYSFSRRRRPRRQQDVLDDWLHKSQDQAGSSFRGAYRSMICVHVFIGVSAHTCISIYVFTVFLKNRFRKVK